jgi:hypothetical protein
MKLLSLCSYCSVFSILPVKPASYQENEVTSVCGVSDPLQELPWLKEWLQKTEVPLKTLVLYGT